MTLIVGWQTQIDCKTAKEEADETVTSLAPEKIMYIRIILIQECLTMAMITADAIVRT